MSVLASCSPAWFKSIYWSGPTSRQIIVRSPRRLTAGACAGPRQYSHVIAKFGREVIDRVRVDQANQLRQDRPARQVIKRSRWLLLRNQDNLSPAQATQLDELLAANTPLMTLTRDPYSLRLLIRV